jgi:hypothetical protein
VKIGRLLAVLFLATCWVDSSAFADEPVRIEIRSSWSGLGDSGKMISTGQKRVIVTGEGGKYLSAGHRVDAKAVTELLSALEDEIVQQPKLDLCGIDEAWLANNYREGLSTHYNILDLSVKQIELFRTHFTDTGSANAAFGSLFEIARMGDYPEISVVVQSGHAKYGVRSRYSNPFMLPWEGIDRPRGGYSCRISRAIADLVPKGFPNRTRLTPGSGFLWNLTDGMIDSIRHDWNLLDTEKEIGPQVAPVFARFTPLESEIGNLGTVDVDAFSRSWNAKLQSPEFPSNLVFGVSLLYDGTRLSGVDAMLAKLPKYAEFLLSVPWLRKYMEDHPETTIELRYVNGRSLSPEAQKSLTEDLSKHNKAELVAAASLQPADDVFIEVESRPNCWSRAIVLPSREVLLWHFTCDSVLGFAAKDLNYWDDHDATWHTAGALIGRDGKLAR